jgi:hypothetical protein
VTLTRHRAANPVSEESEAPKAVSSSGSAQIPARPRRNGAYSVASASAGATDLMMASVVGGRRGTQLRRACVIECERITADETTPCQSYRVPLTFKNPELPFILLGTDFSHRSA